VAAAGLGYLIYSQYGAIEEARAEVQTLHDSIDIGAPDS
jgi:hypothetical protein